MTRFTRHDDDVEAKEVSRTSGVDVIAMPVAGASESPAGVGVAVESAESAFIKPIPELLNKGTRLCGVVVVVASLLLLVVHIGGKLLVLLFVVVLLLLGCCCVDDGSDLACCAIECAIRP